MLAEWRKEHDEGLGPIVLHLTRGQIDPQEIQEASANLQRIDSLTLYHLVKPEYGHPTVFYPADDSKIENESLKTLFAVTSPLLGAAQIAEENSQISVDSRGIVIKGKFTMLLEAINQAMVE